MIVDGIEVQVQRKRVKRLRLAVYPPDGQVRIAVPTHVSDDNVRRLVSEKLDWIRKHQAKFRAQILPPPSEFISGESHYLFGQRFTLEVIAHHGRHRVSVNGDGRLLLFVKPDTDKTKREQVINHWYRNALKQRIPALISKWEPIIGERLASWGVKQMKTRWGSCNIRERRIWLNLQLAKYPNECLEYVFVHEMVHLLERYHNQNFKSHMDRFVPDWRLIKSRLNSSEYRHE